MADVDQLLRALDHPWGEASWAAARELARLGERRAVDPWLAMLDRCLARPPKATAEDRRYWGAIDGLAACREPRAYDRLLRLLRQARGITRQHAASALGRFGDPRAVPALLATLATAGDDRRLHHALALALAELRAPAAIPALLAEFADADVYNIAYRAAEALGVLGEPARAPLLAALGDLDAQVRACAVLGLAALGGEEATQPLAAMLADPDATVRAQAAHALAEHGDRRALPALLAAQGDADAEVRKVAASALRRLGAREGPRPPAPAPGRHVLTVDADYGQFFVGDGTFAADTGAAEFWSKEAFERRLALAPPSLLAVGTSRQYGEVPVVVELAAGPPPLELEGWDRVIEASLDLPSGRLLLDGPIYYQGGSKAPPAGQASPAVELPPGVYRLRLHYGGQDTLDEDHYRLVLWPQAPYASPLPLKPPAAEAPVPTATSEPPDLPALIRAGDLAALETALRARPYPQADLQAALDLAVEYALITYHPGRVLALLRAGADLDAWSPQHPEAARRFAQLEQEYRALMLRGRL